MKVNEEQLEAECEALRGVTCAIELPVIILANVTLAAKAAAAHPGSNPQSRQALESFITGVLRTKYFPPNLHRFVSNWQPTA